MIKKTPVIVILDNIRSVLNVGAIFRTCDAAGISDLYLCGITAYPPHNKLAKTALGATEFVDWKYFKTTSEAIIDAKKRGFQILCVELTSNSKNLWEFSYRFPIALVFGNEVTGISQDILKLADDVIKIPMLGKKESLNIATCAGIIVYETLRRYTYEK